MKMKKFKEENNTIKKGILLEETKNLSNLTTKNETNDSLPEVFKNISTEMSQIFKKYNNSSNEHLGQFIEKYYINQSESNHYQNLI